MTTQSPSESTGPRPASHRLAWALAFTPLLFAPFSITLQFLPIKDARVYGFGLIALNVLSIALMLRLMAMDRRRLRESGRDTTGLSLLWFLFMPGWFYRRGRIAGKKGPGWVFFLSIMISGAVAGDIASARVRAEVGTADSVILIILILLSAGAAFVFYRVVAAPELARERREDDLLRDCLRALDEAQAFLRSRRREDALKSAGKIIKHRDAMLVVSADPAALRRLIIILAEARALEEFVAHDLVDAPEAIFNPLGECLLKYGHPALCLAAFGHKQSRDNEYDYPLIRRAVKAARWDAALKVAGHPGGWWMMAVLMGFISFLILLQDEAAGILTAILTVVPCVVFALRARGFPSEAAVLNDQVSRAFRLISPSGAVASSRSGGPLAAVAASPPAAGPSGSYRDSVGGLLVLLQVAVIFGAFPRGSPFWMGLLLFLIYILAAAWIALRSGFHLAVLAAWGAVTIQGLVDMVFSDRGYVPMEVVVVGPLIGLVIGGIGWLVAAVIRRFKPHLAPTSEPRAQAPKKPLAGPSLPRPTISPAVKVPVHRQAPIDLTFKADDGGAVRLGRELGRGGEGNVYEVEGQPGQCAKIYAANVVNPQLHAKLRAMLANPPKDPTVKSRNHHSIAWPTRILYRGAVDVLYFAGFVMPAIADQDFKKAICRFHPGDRAKHSKGEFTWRHAYTAACNIASAIAAIHERGYCVGDINESNILVAGSTTLVTLIDCDSFQVRETGTGRIFRCAVGKGEYAAPELIGKVYGEVERSPAMDHFGLAVLLFQFMMEGCHPYQARGPLVEDAASTEKKISLGHFPYKHAGKPTGVKPPAYAPAFDLLHQEIQRFFIRAFVDGHKDPSARPTSKEWFDILRKLHKQVIQCGANRRHWYFSRLDACPWCRIREEKGKDPFPAPLK